MLFNSCNHQRVEWNGPKLLQPRNQLKVDQLLGNEPLELVDMSYFAKPDWCDHAKNHFSGTLILEEARLTFSKEKEYYPGENIFPRLHLDFITYEGELIPRIKKRINTLLQSESYWDVFVGAGKVWHENEDGEWSRASFPLTLTDRWVGQARNCVATFVYKADKVSNICLQCSQETADIDDKQLGNINGIVSAVYIPKYLSDSAEIIQQHIKMKSGRLPLHMLNEVDINNEIADYFEEPNYTSAPTSLGAILIDSKLYLHPPKTRHGIYPYPNEMRHGLYSVTKSMAGALALMYFEERYQDDVFSKLISDYVPALANHVGWKGVTFGQTLNMVTGINGGEDAERLFGTLIIAETAEEAIYNISLLEDAAEAPGEKFNYASTNLFVLSCALQNYVEEKERRELNYWDLIQTNVLDPIGAENFSLLYKMEKDGSKGIPILAYGALPTIDEAAKIAMLFANEGRCRGQQIINNKRVKEVFGNTGWNGYSTHNDYRGSTYKHSFWSKEIETKKCRTLATYMLGFGENYVVFMPGNTIIFRFYDEHDLNIDKLIRKVEKIKSSCQ